MHREFWCAPCRNGAFDTSALGKRLGRRRPGLGRGAAKAPEPEPHKSPQRDAKPKKKVLNRNRV